MNMTVILLLTFASIFLLLWLLPNLLRHKLDPQFRRMKEVEKGTAVKALDATIEPESKRWPGHLNLQKVFDEMGRIAKSSLKHEFQVKNNLIAAGYHSESTFRKFMGIKVVAALAGFVFFILLGLFGDQPFHIVLLLAVAPAFVLYLLPDVILRRKVTHWQKEIAIGLPDALDLMVICVEAGLGLNAAILRVGQDMAFRSRALSIEFMRTTQDLRTGGTREKALRAMSDRNRIEDLKLLVGALVLADKLGTSIASTLRAQADGLRTRIRQKAEEHAAKAGVKMLLPLALFILPALFIVLMGPAVLVIMDTFGK